MTEALAPIRANASDSEDRKAHYGESGEQPWDTILASGWGPVFAASNVVKYLRRTKNPEHSLESARWYYARLVEGCAGAITVHAYWPDWQCAVDRLELILTKEERALARGPA